MQALQGSEYVANKDNPEYQAFEVKVGRLKDPDPAPTTPSEKTEDRDVLTREHDEAVKKVINEALRVSTEHFTNLTTKKVTATRKEIIDYALDKLIIPLRQKSLEDSQNLIFRDSDHYFTGWRQEWQISGLFYKPLKRQGTEWVAERGQERRKIYSPPSGPLSYFSEIVAWF